MLSLPEVDRDLDELGVSAGRLSETRARAAKVRPASLAELEAELEALAAGVTPVERAVRAPREEPPEEASGLIEVSEEVLRRSDLPAVLALDGADFEGSPPDSEVSAPLSEVAASAPAPNDDIAGALSALALDLDSGETPIELAPEPTAAREPSAVSRAPSPMESVFDDPTADLSTLLGESDPLLDGGAPLAGSGFDEELPEEHTVMFSAADAERFSRPPGADLTFGEDLEIDIEEVLLDDDELIEASADEGAAPLVGRTQPPPPPRTMPPEPPTGARPSEAPARGFLGKLLQRKS